MKKEPFITAAVGLLGVVAGAWFQHFLTIRQDREKNIRELRLSAYGKFFEGQAKRQQAIGRRAAGDKEEAEKLESEYRSLVQASKFPIAAYGGRAVIDSLAQYFRSDLKAAPCGGSRETWLRDAAIYQRMRREVLQDSYEPVEPGDLVVLLFGCAVPQ